MIKVGVKLSNKKVDIILPPVWAGVYLNVAILLKYSLIDLGFAATITEAGCKRSGTVSILLGWNLLPEEIVNKTPYIIYQLEPLSLPIWKEKIAEKRKLFENAMAVWDYSVTNTDYLESIGLNAKNVPLCYHPKLEEITFAVFPEYDVLFIGFVTERRQKVLEQLQKYCCVSVQQRWGKDFTDSLSRSKILLNLHQYDIPTPLEQPRISYALNNGVFVVTEESADMPYPDICFKKYKDISQTVLYYLYNPDMRNEKRESVFESFKKTSMANLIEQFFSTIHSNHKQRF